MAVTRPRRLALFVARLLVLAMMSSLWPAAAMSVADDCCPHAAASAALPDDPMPCGDEMPPADCAAECALRCAAPTPIHPEPALAVIHPVPDAGPAGRPATLHPRPAPERRLRPPISA